VKQENITRVSRDEWAKMKGKTDWQRVKAMTDEEIEQNALDDPDSQPIPYEMWEDAKVIFPQENGDLDISPDSSSRYPSYEIVPSPRTFQEYEEILPGSMNRILSMAEAQTQHRREIEKRDQEHRIKIEEEETEMKKAVTNSDTRRADLGLVTGFIIAIIGLGGSIYLGINDKTWASGLMGVGTLTGLVTVFVKGNERQRS
jgi:uncharacterized membrane protein